MGYGPTVLKYLDLSTLQRQVLHREVSTLYTTGGSVLHLDLSTLQRPELHLDVSTPRAAELLLDLVGQQEIVLLLDSFILQGLSCTRTYLDNSSLSCSLFTLLSMCRLTQFFLLSLF
jgi:hypothetical protein